MRRFLHIPLQKNFLINLFFVFILQNSFAQNNKSLTNGVPALIPTASFSELKDGNRLEHLQIPLDDDLNSKSGQIINPSPFSMPPPGNDNCAAGLNPPYVLSPNVSCTNGNFTLSTKEPGEVLGACIAATTNQTVWYSFIATQANMWVYVKQTSTPFVCGSNFMITVFRYAGVCPPAAASVAGCKNFTAYSAGQIYNILNLPALSPGSTYLVQLSQRNVCAGFTYDNFCVAVGTPSTCTTCASPCGPMCVFAQPAPPTVPQVVATCPGYMWAPPLNVNDIRTNCYTFTAPNDTVNLQMVIWAYCSPGNTISFTYNLYTSGCGLIQSGNVFANNMITGLTVGQTYRICYTVQAACSWDSLAYPYLYTNNSTLPVEFVSFGAMSFNERVKLYWTTASETNCEEYIVERTTNARDFTEVARVRGAGNSTNLLNYKAYDNAPLEGNNYYRLKQIDFDGKFTYTKLVAAKYSTSASDLYIIPNPAKDKAIVVFNTAGNYLTLLKVTDMQGKTISTKEFISEEGLNEYSLHIGEMAKGIYSVQLIVDDQNLISKLVKE